MPAVRNDQIAIYKKDMYKAEYEGMKSVPAKYARILKVVPNATGAGDKKTQLIGAGRLERHTVEGQDIKFKSPRQGWETLTKYHTYSTGLSLNKEAVEDNVKIGNLLNTLAGQWGEYGVIVKEEMAARIFHEGGNLSGDWVFNGTHTGNADSSGDLMYDSKPLFNLTGNTRSTKGGGTYYNSFASYTMTPAQFEEIYNHHTTVNNRDEEDEIKVNPADTILCKPGSDNFLAERIIDTSQGMPNTDLNDKNPYYGIISEIIDWDYLDPDDDQNAYFVGKKQHAAIEFHERQSQETDFFRDHTNKGYKASVDMRCGIWLKDGAWRAWTRGGGTSA